jgi:tetratricopeptide (TPR) repeat protein
MKGAKFLPLVVIVAGILAYHNSFSVPFMLDDQPSILENPTIRHLWPIWVPLSPPVWRMQGRPLPNLSLALNYALGGYEVWGYHALNLAIHMLVGLTLLGVMRRTLLQPKLRERFGAAAKELALAVAVLWTIHPLQTESVTYVVQRAESIMGLFYLLTLYCFIRGAESQRPGWWYGLSVAACAAGMGSKEVMVSAPLMVLLYDRTFVSGRFREAWRQRWPLYLALATTWILLGYQMVSIAKGGGYSVNMPRGKYVLTQLYAIAHYLQLSVWPHPLVFDYGNSLAGSIAEVLPQALVTVLLLGGTLVSLKYWPSIGFVGIWFFAILAPTSSVIPMAAQTMAERRMYLPLAAVVTLVLAGGYRVLGRRRYVAIGLAGVIVVVFGYLTVRRNVDYRSELAIWADTAAKRPESPRAHYNLGCTLLGLGKVQEAVVEFEQTLQIDPQSSAAHLNLGHALIRQGKVQEAVGHWKQALRIKPDYADAYTNLGKALWEAGRAAEAIEQYRQALRVKPDDAWAHYNLGCALEKMGRVEEAVEHYQQALQAKPDFAEAHYNLATVFLAGGKLPEAIDHYEQTVRIKPNFAEAWNNLGNALATAGRNPEAILRYEQALRLRPDFAEAHNNLGNVLSAVGKVSEAIDHYQQALRNKPDFVEARRNMEDTLRQAGRIQDTPSR